MRSDQRQRVARLKNNNIKPKLSAFASSCLRVSTPSHNNALASSHQNNNIQSKLCAFVSSCLRVSPHSHNNASASSHQNKNIKSKLCAFVSSCLRVSPPSHNNASASSCFKTSRLRAPKNPVSSSNTPLCHKTVKINPLPIS